MRPQQKFHTPEDDEDQVVFRREPEIPRESRRSVPIANLIIFGLMCAYFVMFIQSLQGRWFDPRWTNDDSLQQAFIFHEVIDPGVFTPDDMISDMMKHYVPPIHYWIGMGLTKLTQSPVMTGHWIMLIQVVLALGFLFAAVQRASGFIPACLSVTWLLHTRNTMQRLSGGVPRGWAVPLLAAFLYCLLGKHHKSTLLLLAVAWLLHAPSALLMTGCYGLVLLWQLIQRDTRSEYVKPFGQFILALPLLAFLAIYGVKKPEYLGEMVSYSQAMQMPEFSVENGRFKMVPLWPAWTEIREFGFQAFNTSLTRASDLAEDWIPTIAITICAMTLLTGLLLSRSTFGIEGIMFLLTILLSYWAAREFAFKLFVPQRYIQMPLAIFFITFLPIAVWRLLSKRESSAVLSGALRGTFGLFFVTALVVWGSGWGLTGDANFNMPRFVRGDLWSWVSQTLPKNSVIAGYPSHIDGVQLFGKRRAFVTNETAHPFYDKYYKEMSRRIEISLKAHYALTPKEFLDLVEPEGITHFIYKKRSFYVDALANTTYFAPFDVLVKELTKPAADKYFYKRIPREIDQKKYPFLLYRDEQSVVIDVAALRTFVNSGGVFPKPVV